MLDTSPSAASLTIQSAARKLISGPQVKQRLVSRPVQHATNTAKYPRARALAADKRIPIGVKVDGIGLTPIGYFDRRVFGSV